MIENACPECERLLAAYQDCIFEAHDLRNQSVVLEATNVRNQMEHNQRMLEVEERAAVLNRELSEHRKRDHATWRLARTAEDSG